MPTYDYQCDACDHQFEVFESISAEPQKKCPKCKKNKLRRLFGAGGGLLFKGSGFYLTDYRSESYKKAASADKPAGEGGGKESSSKSEGKGAAKSDSKAASSPAKSSSD